MMNDGLCIDKEDKMVIEIIADQETDKKKKYIYKVDNRDECIAVCKQYMHEFRSD